MSSLNSELHDLIASFDDFYQSRRQNGVLSQPQTSLSMSGDALYQVPVDSNVMKERPWKDNPNYFEKAYVSAMALMTMTIEAERGGSIEVMGMLTGKIVKNAIIVMDAYPLPVEGTETRVNSQAEGYEYMVQYLEHSKKVGRSENIVGWYHSHPGYGCWLSGIDVATQELNQSFQDPYLAIVIDPFKTSESGKVDFDAFRTIPAHHRGQKGSDGKGMNKYGNKLPENKRKDYGMHSDSYYSLEVEVFCSTLDNNVLNLIQNRSWSSQLVQSSAITRNQQQELIETLTDFDPVQSFKSTIANKDAFQITSAFDPTLLSSITFSRFNKVISNKLSHPRGKTSKLQLSQSFISGDDLGDDIESNDTEDEDEDMDDSSSDPEENTKFPKLSEGPEMDDVLSVDSASINKVQDEGDDYDASYTGLSQQLKPTRKRENSDDDKANSLVNQKSRRYAKLIQMQYGSQGLKSIDDNYKPSFPLSPKPSNFQNNLLNWTRSIGSAELQNLLTLKTQEAIFL